MHHCTDSCLSKNIDKKADPNLTFTSCPNRKSKLNILKKNHISTTARGKFTIFAPLYRSLIVKKYLQKSDPNLTFTSCPNRKSKLNITKNYISTTARGKFTICALLYRSLILKKIFTKRWPQFDLYFLSKPEVKVEYLKTNHISTTARGKFKIFGPLYRSLIVKKYFTKKWPQFDLYFLSKPEVKVYYLKKSISQQPQEVNSQFVHYCTDR